MTDLQDKLQTIRDALVHGRTVLNMRNLQLDVGPIHSAITLIDVELAKNQYVDAAPAFPNGTDVTQGQYAPSSGMSLRDYFAAKAMQGLMDHTTSNRKVAKDAYKLADEMMEERK